MRTREKHKAQAVPDDGAVKPEGQVRLGDLLADIGCEAGLSDEEMAAFEHERSPARAVDFD